MSVEPTTAKRLRESAELRDGGSRAGDGDAAADERRLSHWVARYAPADPATQRALHRACRQALTQLGGDPEGRHPARLTPRIVERTIDRYLADLLGIAQPRGRRARARLKVHAMTSRRAPVDRPAATGEVTPLTMAGPTRRRRPGPLDRLQPANTNPAPDSAPAPAPLLPPEAPLEMPEQDLS